MGPSTSQPEVILDGIPLWLFALMTSLAILGIIYAFAILVFNLVKAKNKIIKMTSPNINVIMLVGAIIGYSCIIMFGLDTGYVSRAIMETLQRSCVFILPMSFTVIYGCLFAKSWRIFLVFKNINFNGKLTRDEHLLIGILVMLIIDLAILLPWYFLDPVVCVPRVVSTFYEERSTNTVTYLVDDCYSDLQGVWIGLIYTYKLLMILAGLYFTWQTRNITLPSLKDTKLIYIVVYTIVTSAIIALPVIMISYIGMKTRYACGGLIIWMVLTVTITILFVPKIILEKKDTASSSNVSAFNFLFSESMRKTQEAVRKCSLCFCCRNPDDTDRYAQEMLANEIETLKRTIKQKDASIRELNDRLYIGAEKFQEYLTNPKSNRSVLQAMQEKYEAKKNRERQFNQDLSIDPIAADNGIQIQCPKPRTATANGYVVDAEPVKFTSTPQKMMSESIQRSNGYAVGQYDDEGIHSSDSHNTDIRGSRKDISDGFYQQQQHPQQRQQLQTVYKPIATVSNGQIPHGGSFPRGGAGYHGNHSRNPSRVSQYSHRSIQSYHKSDNPTSRWPPSPNQDSAFDDNTPSSDGYDKYQPDRQVYVQNQVPQTNNVQYHDDANSQFSSLDRQFSQIDLGAMEYDAMKNFQQRTPSMGRKYENPAKNGGVPHHYYNNNGPANMAVSQI